MSARPFLHWLNSNLGLLLLAVLLSFVVWLSAVFSADPNETCTDSGTVPLEILGLPENMRLFGDVPETASISLFAPRSVCQQMAADPNAVHVYIDLEGYEPGAYELSIRYEIDPRYTPVRVLGFAPAEVSVSLEEFLVRTLPLTLLVTGEPAPGYTAGASILSDSRVVISGTRTLVDQVVSAVAMLDITDAVGEINVSRQVSLLGAAGGVVTGIDIFPGAVTIRQIINRPGSFREVIVRVVYTGAPADGYRLTSITPTPQIVTLFSSDADLIRTLPGFVETEPVDLSNATDDIEQRLRLVLPEGVFVDGDQTVLVQVGIAAIESSLTLSLSVELIGLAPGLEAMISPMTVDVLLFGPLPILTSLQPLDVRVVLDLAGFEIGSYNVAPRIEIIPIGISIEAILPGAIEVVIIQAATPTPTGSPVVFPPPTITPIATPSATGTP